MNEKKRKNILELNWSEEAHFDQYDIVRHFISEKKMFPNNTILSGISNNGYVCFDVLYQKLKTNAELIHISNNFNNSIRRVYFNYNGTFYILETIYSKLKSDFKNIKDFNEFLDKKSDSLKIVYNITLLHEEIELLETHKNLINSCILKSNIITTIGMISRDNNGFYLNNVPFKTPELSMELDLHYGENFTKFHKKLCEKLCEKSKGITLLYGIPGGGKSSYIKSLIHDLSDKTTKQIVFLPSSLTHYLLEPDFNDFLLSLSDNSYIDVDFNEDEPENSNVIVSKGIILIIEEAQNILKKRDIYDSNQSIANILNLTDGIMNDIYGVQIIATHNTSDSEIEPALLRSGRLLAKKEFKKLSVKETNKLAKHIGLKKEFTKEMTVADIYSYLNEEDNSILIDNKKDKKDIGV